MHSTLTGSTKKLKIQRPNSLKIAILMVILYSEAREDKPLRKEGLYRIIRDHYGIKNSRPIKNQIEMLKAYGIIHEINGFLHARPGPEFLFKLYRVIWEAPDDIFPIYQREIDFFRFATKTNRDPREVWREVLEKRYSGNNRTEPEYLRQDLFIFFLTSFLETILSIGPDLLSFCALRYLAKLIYEDLRINEQRYTWLYPEIQELKAEIMKRTGPETQYEAVFEILRASVTPDLKERITNTCFPPVGDTGNVEYILSLGSPSLLLFFFEIESADVEKITSIVGAGYGDKIYSGMLAYVRALVITDSLNMNFRHLHYNGYEFRLSRYPLGVISYYSFF